MRPLAQPVRWDSHSRKPPLLSPAPTKAKPVIPTGPIVTRFAPSPTGYLHLGHVRSAFEGWRAAREAGGRFLLRLEDIDVTRCRDDYATAIIEDLGWLGLDWDGPVRRQSQHFDDYQTAIDHLDALGVLYPCFCTRREIQAEIARAGGAPQGDLGPPYPGTCRHLAPADRLAKQRAGHDFALRLDVVRALALTGPLDWIEEGSGTPPLVKADPAALGDVVLARKDAPTSYHLAVTVDDALQGVTLVTRGVDLAPSTHIHRLLQALLGLATPRYRHHPLLTDTTGRRLAKRDRAQTIRAMRADGIAPCAIVAQALSWSIERHLPVPVPRQPDEAPY
jgi:glutamyl-Q tRNA(Asp) synthetase